MTRLIFSSVMAEGLTEQAVEGKRRCRLWLFNEGRVELLNGKFTDEHLAIRYKYLLAIFGYSRGGIM